MEDLGDSVSDYRWYVRSEKLAENDEEAMTVHNEPFCLDSLQCYAGTCLNIPCGGKGQECCKQEDAGYECDPEDDKLSCIDGHCGTICIEHWHECGSVFACCAGMHCLRVAVSDPEAAEGPNGLEAASRDE